MSIVGQLIRHGVFLENEALHFIGEGDAAKNAAIDTKTKLLGAGTSSVPFTLDVANTRFLNFNLDCGASSGDNRGMYLRLMLTGGGGGEALRVFTNVNSDLGTAHGAHISLNFGTSNEVTGQAIAARCTLHVPNAVMAANGTYAALQAEVFMDGTTSDPSAATQFSLMRFVVAGGNATARDRVKKLFTIEGVTSGASNMIQTGQNEPTWTSKTCLIRVIIAGTPMNLIAVDPS